MSSTKSTTVGILIVAYLIISPIVMGYLAYDNYSKGDRIFRLEAKMTADKDLKELEVDLANFDATTKQPSKAKK